MYVLETNSGLFKELGDVSSLRGLEESTLVGGGSAWLRREWVALGSLTLTGAVLHDFTIGLFDMRSLCWITCIFDENTLLYTLCICVLCRSKANNCGYIVI